MAITERFLWWLPSVNSFVILLSLDEEAITSSRIIRFLIDGYKKLSLSISIGIPFVNSIDGRIVRFISPYSGYQRLYIHIILCGQGLTSCFCNIIFIRNVFPQDVGPLKIPVKGCIKTKRFSLGPSCGEYCVTSLVFGGGSSLVCGCGFAYVSVCGGGVVYTFMCGGGGGFA